MAGVVESQPSQKQFEHGFHAHLSACTGPKWSPLVRRKAPEDKSVAKSAITFRHHQRGEPIQDMQCRQEFPVNHLFSAISGVHGTVDDAGYIEMLSAIHGYVGSIGVRSSGFVVRNLPTLCIALADHPSPRTAAFFDSFNGGKQRAC